MTRPSTLELTLQEQEIYWSHVEINGPDECWPWLVCTDDWGGEQILETTGAYSDYSVVAIWAVLKEFNPESVKTMAEAQAQGLVAKMEYREWWQG